MRILIFSDTHDKIDNCITAIDGMPHVDMILHAGDCASDAEDLSYAYPHIPVHFVKGNNDFYSNAPAELLINAGGKRIFVTHGHLQRVKFDIEFETLIEYAKERSADLAVFGHTHMPYEGFFSGVTLLNPGSIRYGGTYAICDIENEKIRNTICTIK
jgi:hypothetical protein